MNRAFPWIIVGLAAVYALAHLKPASTPPDGFRLQDFGKIPVAHNGRVKPMDTFARIQLRALCNKETSLVEVRKDAAGQPVLEKQPALRWLLDLMADATDRGTRARKHKVFRIVHPQVLHGLGLQEVDGFRYAVDDFGDKLERLGPAMETAHGKAKENKQPDAHDRALMQFSKHLRMVSQMMALDEPHMVPPDPVHKEWKTLPAGMDDGHGHAPDEAAKGLLKILEAYARGDAAGFNAEVAAHLARVGTAQPKDASKAAFETFFNRFDPFLICKVFYLGAFLLSIFAWLGWATPLNRAAFRLIQLSFVLHTLALIARIYMSGRPPVTNLYGSAIFIGWGMVLAGLAFERLFKLGIGNVVGSIAGFSTLLIAYILAAEGDTMEVLQAVLDTQFWLATHVTTITLGYSATFVAGLVGVAYILTGLFTRALSAELRAVYARMIYGTTCFAMFFSFVGTVLGGLWADDSWGRFWGWDPKENGALMIVLWNALLLHARWGGLVRERGLAAIAVFGNVVTAWSWFGVNELGKGLHSYGFTEGRALTLAVFILSQIVIMSAAFLPRSYWKSPEAVRVPESHG